MLITIFLNLLYYHFGAGRSFSICPTGALGVTRLLSAEVQYTMATS